MDARTCDYERKIFLKGIKNTHILPWGAILVRNADEEGKLVTFGNEEEHRESLIKMWVLCLLLVFRDPHNDLFPVFRCEECSEMENLQYMTMDQRRLDIDNLKCFHSKLCDKVISRSGQDWKEIFPSNYDEIEIYETCYQVECNLNRKYVLLLQKKLFLACVYRSEKKQKIAVLYTYNAKKKKPVCSLCSSIGCGCYR